MTNTELLIMAVVLSLDAFSVAVCKGLALGKIKLKHTLIVGLWFGFFQALMPLVGYFVGEGFGFVVTKIAPWIAFVLLCMIGVNMIKEAFECEECADCSLCLKAMLPLAVATSIDALAVGVTLSMTHVENIFFAVGLIGVVTLLLSAVGVKIGSVFGTKYNKRAQITGGVVLCVLGLKILLEHYGII